MQNLSFWRQGGFSSLTWRRICTARFYGEERGGSGEASEAPKLQRMSKDLWVWTFVHYLNEPWFSSTCNSYWTINLVLLCNMHEVLRIERFKEDNTKSITNVPNLIVNNLIKLRKYLFCDYGGGGGGGGGGSRILILQGVQLHFKVGQEARPMLLNYRECRRWPKAA